MDLRAWLSAPHPDRAVWFADDADGWVRHPYGDVADRARRVATILHDNGFRTGDGVCVIFPTGLDAVAASFGAWAAGGWFTPIAPPMFEDLDAYRDHVAGLLRTAEPRVVVTEADCEQLVAAAMSAAGRNDAPVVLTAELLSRTAPTAVAADAGTVCLVQFTSGSTGTPRGVRVGWANLADNLARIGDVAGWRDGDATASWLPLFHDMGLVGALVMTVVHQGDLYLMRPDQFVRDPARWLRAMTHAQHSPAPAFALDYVTRRTTAEQIRELDLSGWRRLILGAEPVPPTAVVRFARQLEPAGFRLDAVTVAYGLAETTLFASSAQRPVAIRIDPADLTQGAHVGVLERRVLGVDVDLAGSGWLTGVGSDPSVTVVDDAGVPVPDGVLGELRVTGDSVALGYLGADGATVFDGTLDTGDAGFRYGGELYVLGRLGTSLKVRGKTVFMETVEARVCADAGLAPGRVAAVAVPTSRDVAVVIVGEYEPGDWEPAALRAAASVVGLDHPVRIVTGPRGTILRTSSGKPRRRAMAASPLLADQGLYGLFERSRTVVPTDAAVLLEGSIAEGFGNAGSDVDFLVVLPGDEQTPTMPTVLFVDGRRVEVRTRSVAQLRAQVERVRRGDATEDTLNRVQRFGNARIVRSGGPDVAALRALLPAPEFAEHMRRWWTDRAVQALRYATALHLLDTTDEALGWASDGLDQAMKAWAAGRGETYLESKWLPHQLDRIGTDELINRYRSVDRNDLTALLDCARLAGADIGSGQVRLLRRPGITTWPIGGRIHVLRNRADLFVLSDAAARTWRGVVFGRPVTDTPSAERVALATFVQLGFVGLRWDAPAPGDTAPITPALAMCDVVAPYTPVPSVGAPAVSIAGAHRDDAAVTLSPLPARRFAECALTLVWSNIVVENAREDLAGATKDEQWAVAAIAAHRAVAMCVRVLLSAFGIQPLPADVAPTTTVRRLLGQLEEVDAALVAAEAIRVVDAASARAGSDAVDRLVDAVRSIVGASAFPTSFASRSQWRATLEIGYDWLRLAGYLDTTLPLDEARDLLESGGVQPQEAP